MLLAGSPSGSLAAASDGSCTATLRTGLGGGAGGVRATHCRPSRERRGITSRWPGRMRW